MCTQCRTIASELPFAQGPSAPDGQHGTSVGDSRATAATASLDIGRARIGLALSPANEDVAMAHNVLHRKGTRRDVKLLGEFLERHQVEHIVVGLPPESDATEHCTARLVRQFCLHLVSAQHRSVLLVDEADTSVEADQHLRQLGLRASRRRRVIDQEAAAQILRRYLRGAPTLSLTAGPTSRAALADNDEHR